MRPADGEANRRRSPGDGAVGQLRGRGNGLARVTAVAGHLCRAAAGQARRFSLSARATAGHERDPAPVTWVMIPPGCSLSSASSSAAIAVRRGGARLGRRGWGWCQKGCAADLRRVRRRALRLARRVLVSELAAIEGLARVDVLCTDKTGTLTRPGMRLAATEVLDSQPAARITEILAAIAAADPDPNPTVRAIASGRAEDPGWAVKARVPFSSARKWSGALVRRARHLAARRAQRRQR